MTASGNRSFGSKGTAFQRLHQLLADTTPGRDAINMSIGEPQHSVPDFIAGILSDKANLFNKYPPISGLPEYRETVASWLNKRYGTGDLITADKGVLPLSGTREGLFFGALEARRRLSKDNPVILLPNPLYAAYAAGIVAAGCEPALIDAPASQNFFPDFDTLDKAVLDRTVAIYFASPSNPQGAVFDLVQWADLIERARTHNFYIFADECYSEIYRNTPPPGALEAARETGSADKVLVFHSLSKRSNLAGLRSGFVAGDPDFLANWVQFRNMAAPQVPIPAQYAAIAALEDEAHVIENRRLYNQKYAIADRLLAGRYAYQRPEGGFFLWLDVSAFGDGEAITKALWHEEGVKVVPGAFLSEDMPDGSNPGTPYIRLALVNTPEETETALARLNALTDRLAGRLADRPGGSAQPVSGGNS
ncbi:aminotransferase class I/II-fold pyridoxal phosphate-dependent enzyme [Coralliovum pocilloporae]|uniref:aminotransferase class I/II-fold pyridoxal phosphate-dependent enzyme n=1 Tax=Coralliovum pocilloporae TaxID=3066369 RepID=UPI003306B8A3